MVHQGGSFLPSRILPTYPASSWRMWHKHHACVSIVQHNRYAHIPPFSNQGISNPSQLYFAGSLNVERVGPDGVTRPAYMQEELSFFPAVTQPAESTFNDDVITRPWQVCMRSIVIDTAISQPFILVTKSLRWSQKLAEEA